MSDKGYDIVVSNKDNLLKLLLQILKCKLHSQDTMNAAIKYHSQILLVGAILGSRKISLNNISEYKNRPRYIATLIYYGYIPVGCMLITDNEVNFYIKKQHRRKGLASILYYKTITECGVKDQLVNKTPKNKVALKFIQSLNIKSI